MLPRVLPHSMQASRFRVDKLPMTKTGDESRHRSRNAAKKSWYATEFFPSLYPQSAVKCYTGTPGEFSERPCVRKTLMSF